MSMSESSCRARPLELLYRRGTMVRHPVDLEQRFLSAFVLVSFFRRWSCRIQFGQLSCSLDDHSYSPL
jgi:hypothetical protein